MSFSKFKINVTPIGRGSTVEVDGVDVSKNIKAMALFAHASEATILQLHTYGEGTIVGEGVVEVIREDNSGMAAWLRSVNRSKVDELALQRGGWGSASTLTDNVIEVLLEMLDEAQSQPNS